MRVDDQRLDPLIGEDVGVDELGCLATLYRPILEPERVQLVLVGDAVSNKFVNGRDVLPSRP